MKDWARRVLFFLSKTGATPESAKLLSRAAIPWYMKVGVQYKVISGPIFVRIIPFSTDTVYRYSVQNFYLKNSPILYFESFDAKIPSEGFYIQMSRNGRKAPIFHLVPRRTGNVRCLEVKKRA